MHSLKNYRPHSLRQGVRSQIADTATGCYLLCVFGWEFLPHAIAAAYTRSRVVRAGLAKWSNVISKPNKLCTQEAPPPLSRMVACLPVCMLLVWPACCRLHLMYPHGTSTDAHAPTLSTLNGSAATERLSSGVVLLCSPPRPLRSLCFARLPTGPAEARLAFRCNPSI